MCLTNAEDADVPEKRRPPFCCVHLKWSQVVVSQASVYISIAHHNLKHSCLREGCIVGNVKARFELECEAQKKIQHLWLCMQQWSCRHVISSCLEECFRYVTLWVRLYLNEHVKHVSVRDSVCVVQIVHAASSRVDHTRPLSTLVHVCRGEVGHSWLVVSVCQALFPLWGTYNDRGSLLCSSPTPIIHFLPSPLYVSMMVTPQAPKRRQESDSSLPTQTDYTFIHAAKKIQMFQFSVCSYF